MDKPTYSLEFLHQQHALWLRLAAALEEAQAALLTGNVVAYENWTGVQRQCCEQLLPFRRFEQARARLPFSEQSGAILEQIESLARKVCRLNQVHRALLRRASRSLRIFRNLLERNDVAYVPSICLRPPMAGPGPGGK